MRRTIWLFFLTLVFMQGSVSFSQQDNLKVWKEFVLLYKNNELSQEHIRPHQEFPREQLMETLNRLRKSVPWEEKDSAFNIFLDGLGYFLAAKAWVPFIPPQKAFILYLCWEQANLKGNAVTPEKLEDREALVKIESIYFSLYRRTAHLKHQISFEDYRKIFEPIWHDRAKKAGWNLKIEYRLEEDECKLHFSR